MFPLLSDVILNEKSMLPSPIIEVAYAPMKTAARDDIDPIAIA